MSESNNQKMEQQRKGILIVIDGTDGSGKATQIRELTNRLQSEGHDVATLDFPRYYDNFFGEFIGKALKGEFGDWKGLNPKIASIVYACDRAESKPQILEWLGQGKVVLLDRYVSSNQIHQGGKIEDEDERREFLTWLDTMEHEVLGSPRPDLILYLDVPVDVTQTLLKKKETQDEKRYLEGKKDQHESDIQHLEDARNSGLKMLAEHNNWKRILCTENGNILSINTIHELIYQEVKPLLP